MSLHAASMVVMAGAVEDAPLLDLHHWTKANGRRMMHDDGAALGGASGTLQRSVAGHDATDHAASVAHGARRCSALAGNDGAGKAHRRRRSPAKRRPQARRMAALGRRDGVGAKRRDSARAKRRRRWALEAAAVRGRRRNLPPSLPFGARPNWADSGQSRPTQYGPRPQVVGRAEFSSKNFIFSRSRLFSSAFLYLRP